MVSWCDDTYYALVVLANHAKLVGSASTTCVIIKSMNLWYWPTMPSWWDRLVPHV
jgi:hypothetical protein